MEALIFDCDGVLVDTERDGHRVAFNQALKGKGIDAFWSVEEYRELLKIAGGKERMTHYFDLKGWPENYPDKNQLIMDLHNLKTRLFMKLIESGALPLRSGIRRIIDEAIAENIPLAICSTSNERSVNLLVEIMLGSERKAFFKGIFAGDVVSRKKPAPDIYLLCASGLNINPERCIVVEDNRNGLLAAKAAGFKCLITTNDYSKNEDFNEADLVVEELGDEPDVKVSLTILKEIIKKNFQDKSVTI